MSLSLGSALAAQAVETSGQPLGRAISGLSQLILESSRNVRVNRNTTGAILRRVREMADTVANELENRTRDDDYQQESQALVQFETALYEIHDLLLRQGQRSYFAQFLFNDRDKDALSDLSDRLGNAYSVLMVELNFQTSVLSEALTSQFEGMMARVPLPTIAESEIQEPVLRLPPKPQLHFGRYTETLAVVDMLSADDPARVAILGGPGLGKTTLSVAILHHPTTAARFRRSRFFVACDSAEGRSDCLTTIAGLLGIPKSTSSAMQQRLVELLSGAPALLVLDNFESAWEAENQRADAEHVLRFLDSLPNLSLILTLRGAERPQGLRWTRPFLPPLSPLVDAAAEQVFLTISGIPDTSALVGDLLQRLGNLPLAIVLMANLAQSESGETLLRRWNSLHTSMLTRSDGRTRLTSLDASISLSLQSPRMLAVPGAGRLLGILSLLPCGVVDTDVHLWSMNNTKKSLSTLLQTSLASLDSDRRVHVLAPIRSFMLEHHAPPEHDLATVYDNYFGLAELARDSINVAFRDDMFTAVTPELSNMDSVIRYALQHSSGSHKAAINAVVSLCILYTATGMGTGPELLPLALAVAREGHFDDLRADLLFQWGRMAYNGSAQGDPQNLYRQAHEIYQRTGNTDGVIESGSLVAQFLTPQEAIRENRRLFAMAEARDNARLMAQCAQRLAIALERNGDSVASIAQHELTVSIIERTTGHANLDRVAGMSLCYIAETHSLRGDISRSVEIYQKAAAIFERVHFAVGLANIHTKLADDLLFLGRPIEAIDHASRVLAVPGAPGFRTYARCLLTLARAHILAGNTGDALSVIEKVEGLRASYESSTAMQAKILRARGYLAFALGDLAGARALLVASRAVSGARDISEPPEFMLNAVASTTDALCEVEIADGRSEEAFTLAVSAAVLFRKANNSISTVNSLLLLAEVVDDDLAALLLQTVTLPLYRMGHVRGLAISLLRSAVIAQNQSNWRLARHRALNALKRFGDVRDERRVRVATNLAEEK
ncbi:hypothetical protein AURDEDRAFT_163367 [Auricularia subglabra TFB-10046 SS5]|nr:hypothetical protein AURDEDRAFT_163367 [Auricularia subglabra TFB-10046 SS5]